MKEDLKQINDKMYSMDVRITELVKQSQDMTQDITEVRTQMGEHDRVLKSQITMMHQVKKDLIVIRDQQYRSNLRIRGYPETSEEKVKLIQEVLDWVTSILPDVPFTRYDIDVIHRVGPKRVETKEEAMEKLRELGIINKEEFMEQIQKVNEMLKLSRREMKNKKEDLQEKGKLDEATGVTSSL
ncbi:hypothetical protein E2320_007333 [Naja naja]|nr:hypothetical protein E2320_007333 [Naja naja]